MDPKVGMSHISGGPWVNMDPKFGGVLHLWGVLGPCGPQNSGVPRAPQNSGTSSLFLGCPGPTRTPKLGGPPHLWGARGLQRPRIRGYPFLRGVPCGNLGVPLLCGVSGYLEHPETQGSAWTPKFRGSPLLWGALGPQHPKTWGGGSCVPPNSGGTPFDSVSWSRVRPKTWGSHAHPEIRGPPPLWGARVPRVPQNSGVALISGVPSSHLYPKTGGSPPIWGVLGPSVPQNWGGSRVHPKTQGPPHCPLGALGSCAP